MAELTLNKMITWAVLLFFIIGFFYVLYSNKGLYSKLSKFLVSSTERFLPSKPQKDITKAEVPQIVIDVQSAFMEDLTKNPEQQNCKLIFSSLEALDDYNLELVYSENKITSFIEMPVGEEGGQRFYPKTTEQELKLCVIEPKAFYDCYLADKNRNCEKQYYIDLNSAIISKESMLINGEEYDLRHNFLFKPTKDRVCFIPTERGFGSCEAHETALDNDCIPTMEYVISKCVISQQTS